MNRPTDAPALQDAGACDQDNTCARQADAPAEEQQEIQRLQDALSSTLEQLHSLQAEYDALEKKLAQETGSLALRSGPDAQVLRQQRDAAERQCRQLQYRLENLEKKYDALANSKLGRLTLNYWAQQKSGQGNRVLTALLFLFKWLFNRLPSAEALPAGSVPAGSVPAGSVPAEVVQVLEGEAAQASSPAAPAVMTEAQEAWALPYLEQIKQIPDSNGCRYYAPVAFRVGIVCDEFFYESIKAAANFVYLTPENWREELEQGLDVLLFVSAWRGLNMEWKNLASLNAQLTGEPTPTRLEALAMLRACREQKVPTVFYSKEDPPNYELFLDLARECDYVFTSAKECIPYYNADCGREDVQAVCFGINPLEHNPIGCRQEAKEDTVLFSGSWMVKYPHRCQELATIFDGVLAAGHGLHIIDRNYPGNPRYRFPEPYSAHTSPALPHSQLQKVHKLFDLSLIHI